MTHFFLRYVRSSFALLLVCTIYKFSGNPLKWSAFTSRFTFPLQLLPAGRNPAHILLVKCVNKEKQVTFSASTMGIHLLACNSVKKTVSHNKQTHTHKMHAPLDGNRAWSLSSNVTRHSESWFSAVTLSEKWGGLFTGLLLWHSHGANKGNEIRQATGITEVQI